MRIRRLIIYSAKILFFTALIVFFLQLIYMLALKWFYPPITMTQMASYAAGNGLYKRNVSWGQISGVVKLAVISGEDPSFVSHWGFDYDSIRKYIYDWSKGRRLQGGSTLTQQAVKNTFLWQGGGWFRKGLEAYLALMAEVIWGKRRIMEIYLNVAEMGHGIFGIEAASQVNFHKSAMDLNPKEAALIVASLPNPKKYTVNPLSPYVNLRYQYILKRMKEISMRSDILKFLSAEGPLDLNDTYLPAGVK
jgi:monofunctional biosynthetic peptidoglycan transglycosylase